MRRRTNQGASAPREVEMPRGAVESRSRSLRDALVLGLHWPRRALSEIGRRAMWRVYRRALSGELSHHRDYRRVLEERRILDGARSLFSIGPGDGVFEIDWLERGGERLGFVEAFAPHVRALERGVEDLGLGGRIAERHVEGFQSALVRERYDLVVSLHSWFGFGCDEALLRKALALRAAGGRLVIGLSREDDFFTGQLVRKRGVSAEELSRWAKEKGYGHDVIEFDREIRRDVLVRDGKLTAQARDAIAFFLGRPWRWLPTGQRRELAAAVVERTADEPAIRRYACLIFGPAS